MLFRSYLELKDAPNTMDQRRIFREAVKASEQAALEMVGELFIWLDSLEPQPMPREKAQNAEANVIGPLAKQMGLLRMAVEKGFRKIRAILIS